MPVAYVLRQMNIYIYIHLFLSHAGGPESTWKAHPHLYLLHSFTLTYTRLHMPSFTYSLGHLSTLTQALPVSERYTLTSIFFLKLLLPAKSCHNPKGMVLEVLSGLFGMPN